MRRLFISLITMVLLGGPAGVAGAGLVNMTLHKQAGCMCCDAHAEILETQGFEVEVISHQDLNRFKRANNIPREFAGCHTIFVDDYIVEGHVPGDMIARLITEKPDIRGISLPGMPVGSPGMPGERTKSLDVFVITDGEKVIYDSF